MLKFLIVVSLVAYCLAEDYYKLKIDHEFKGLLEPQTYGLKESNGNNQYKSDGYQRRGGDYDSDSYEKYQKQSYRKPSYEESYGQTYSRPAYMEPKSYEQSYEKPSYTYERPSYERQSYQTPSYERQSYQTPSYERPSYEKSYSSPIHAYRNVEIKPIQTQGYDQKDHVIDVKDDEPIVIHFRTHANRIKVEQTRIPEKAPKVEHQRSEDEPHRVVHEVYKPVIQEVREIIQPFRKVVQQVQPVLEEVQTVVHKGQPRYGNNGDGGSGGGDYESKRVSGYSKRSTVPTKKYNTIKDYLPQGSVLSIKGIPVYRSVYRGPAVPDKNDN